MSSAGVLIQSQKKRRKEGEREGEGRGESEREEEVVTFDTLFTSSTVQEVGLSVNELNDILS